MAESNSDETHYENLYKICANIIHPYTVDERPNLGYDSEKVKNFSPQTGFEPTPLGEMSFQAVSSTTEL